MKTEITLMKRLGNYEPFDETKLRRVLLWAADNSEPTVNSIIEALQIRLYDRMHISTLFDELIDTTYNLINRITPEYESVTKKLYIQKMYKELWQMNRNYYPHLNVYLQKVLDAGIIIDYHNHFTNDELNDLSAAIKPERDMRSSYLGLQVFFDKYSLKINNKPVELLQHGFMRLAMQAYINDKSSKRISKIIQRYNNLSLGYYTEATPKWRNSLRPNYQAASCCVHKMDDNTESINQVVSDIGQYSRYDGGNACDVSALRASGSLIGTKGQSSGPIPFIRKIQAAVEAYNQSGSRPGICIVTFPWWHADVQSMLKLMDEGGKENQRARNLKYTIRINRIFLRAIKSNSDIHLFDPKDTPLLLSTFGSEFDEAYDNYVKQGLSKQIINARTLAYELAKERSETGNVYIFFSENVNEQSIFNDIIHSSNACTEIFLPTFSPEFVDSSIEISLADEQLFENNRSKAGLTALCNLSSVNAHEWMIMSQAQRLRVAYELLEASDNQIDDQYYPTKSGEIFNRNYRAIGIGINNLAYAFAKRKIPFDSDKAKSWMEKLSLSMKATFDEAEAKLVAERGNFNYYNRTKLTRPARFATKFSIAPTSTSSLIINATEGIEPVSKLLTEKTGTYSSKQLVPELRECGPNYQLAEQIPTKALYDLAAIRQRILLDQGQSINTYAKNPESAHEVISDIIYAESIGLKSLYYLQSKTSVLEVCDGCSS